jgi:hypothetical protein
MPTRKVSNLPPTKEDSSGKVELEERGGRERRGEGAQEQRERMRRCIHHLL